MTAKQYDAVIQKLGITHYQAAHWLGIDMKTAYAYKNGHYPVPQHLARLLRMVEHYHLTPEQASKIWSKA
jgi:hypothetical protein